MPLIEGFTVFKGFSLDYLVNPEVFTHLLVKTNGPGVTNIVELHEIGDVPKPHGAVLDAIVPIRIEDVINWHPLLSGVCHDMCNG